MRIKHFRINYGSLMRTPYIISIMKFSTGMDYSLEKIHMLQLKRRM